MKIEPDLFSYPDTGPTSLNVKTKTLTMVYKALCLLLAFLPISYRSLPGFLSSSYIGLEFLQYKRILPEKGYCTRSYPPPRKFFLHIFTCVVLVTDSLA